MVIPRSHSHSAPLLGERARAAKVGEVSAAELSSDEAEGLDGWREDGVEVGWDTLGQEHVQQARGDLGVGTRLELATSDEVLEVDDVEATVGGVATELDWVEGVHLEDLLNDQAVGVWLDTVGPVVGNLLLAVEAPGAISVLDSTEEGGDGWEVGSVAASARWHELVQERGGSEQQQAERSEVEVGVVVARVLVTLATVGSKTLKVKVASGGVNHLAEERAVVVEVVATAGEVVVAGKRRVGLKLVVSVEAGLGTGQDWVERSAAGSIASDGELLCDEVAVGKSQTEKGEEGRQVVSDVVDVLLCVHKLVESNDTIVSKEVVVGSNVQAGARSTDVPGVVWGAELMSSVTRRWDEVTSSLIALSAVLGIVVWELGGDWSSWNVVGVERTLGSRARANTRLLSAETLTLSVQERGVDTFEVGNEGERRGSCEEQRSGGEGLHVEGVSSAC